MAVLDDIAAERQRLTERLARVDAERKVGPEEMVLGLRQRPASTPSQITPMPTIATPVMTFCRYQFSSVVHSVRGERMPYR